MSENVEKNRNHSSPRAYRADQISALVWIVGGVVVLFQSLKLDFMEEYGPGPGFLPFLLAVGVIILGLALFVKATFFSVKTKVVEFPTNRAAYNMIIVITGIFCLALFAETIGFLICIGLLFLLLLVFVEKKGWIFSCVMAIASPLVMWLIFEVALGLRLPMGLFDISLR